MAPIVTFNQSKRFVIFEIEFCFNICVVKGHGLVSEADNTGLHHIDGILVVISTANLGGQVKLKPNYFYIFKN